MKLKEESLAVSGLERYPLLLLMQKILLLIVDRSGNSEGIWNPFVRSLKVRIYIHIYIPFSETHWSGEGP